MIDIDEGNESAEDLLVQIRNEHERERGLCDLLEHIADELPGALDLVLIAPVVTALRSVLKRHIVLHEHFLMPRLVDRTEKSDTVELLGKQAAAEHIADESLAHDIADELERAVERARVDNAGMLGYMLYCFFESRRRHLMWEDIVILPMANRLLDESERCSFCASEFSRLVDGSHTSVEYPPGNCTDGAGSDRPEQGKKR